MVLLTSLRVCLSGKCSKIIGPKGLKLLGFDWGHPRDVISKFGKNQFIC